MRQKQRFRLPHLFGIVITISVILFLFTGESSSRSNDGSANENGDGENGTPASYDVSSSSDLGCPTSSTVYPSIVLQGDELSMRDVNRTFSLGATKFLPYLTGMDDNEGDAEDEFRFALGQKASERRECVVHRVPSSVRSEAKVRAATGWKDSSLMFGMATTHDRVIFHLPVWNHWLPSGKSFSSYPGATSAGVPSLLVLGEERSTPAEEKRKFEAERQIREKGLEIKLVKTKGDTFALRYFNLVEAMWTDALLREGNGEDRKEWFAFL